MSWSITELARMSGVTARALRHYDEIGVLRPARVGDNGYRWYEREQLLRLQEILLMRQLDMDLPTIARILDGDHDRLAALWDHRERLLAQRDRLDRLVRTVARTIADLEGEEVMPDNELFDGFRFSPATLDELEAKSPESSKPYFDELRANTAQWTERDFAAANEQAADGERRLLALGPDVKTILVGHWPLIRQPTHALRFPEFAQWCGTTRTADWHIRFRASVVVYGHLHIPRTTYYDGVRFEEVSIGYPREWSRRSKPPMPRKVLPA